MKLRPNQRCLSALISLALPAAANAATWASNFDGVDDDVFDNIAGASGGGFIDGANEWFVSTTNVDNQVGTAYVPDLTPGFAAGTISANFDLNQSRGSDVDEADGAVLFFGAFANNTSPLADGFGLTSGLRLRFHIENNGLGGTPDEAISIFYDNTEVFTTQMDLTTDTVNFRSVSFSVDASGNYDILFNGSGFTNSSGTIPGWSPESGWQYVLSGRTGGRNAEQYFDNVVLNAETIPEPSGVILLSLAGVFAFARRRRV